MRWGIVATAVAVALCGGSASSATSPWDGVALVWVHVDSKGYDDLWGVGGDLGTPRSLGVEVGTSGETRAFSWSQDGDRFAFLDGYGALVLDTTTLAIRRVPGSEVCLDHVVLGSRGRVLCEGGESGDRLYLVSGGRATLEESDTGADDMTVHGAAWGPRDAIAASWDNAALGIFTIDPRWHELKDLHVNGSNPNWSPDGREIVYDETEPNLTVYRRDVWVVAVGSRKHPRRLAVGAHPSFSPDGRLIAFDRDGAIFVMRADGTGVRRVTRTQGRDIEPLWRPR